MNEFKNRDSIPVIENDSQGSNTNSSAIFFTSQFKEFIDQAHQTIQSGENQE